MADSQSQLEVSKIVDEVKSQGLFDQLRRDCLAEVESEPAYRRLKDQVDQFCKKFLARQKWRPNLDKTELRNRLKDQLLRADFVNAGVKNLVDRLMMESKVQKDLYPLIERIVYSHLGLPHPSDSQPKTPDADSSDGLDKKASGPSKVRQSGSSDDYKNDSAGEGPSKRRRVDKDSDSMVSETGPPSQLPSEGDNTSTFETPVQDELNAPPIDPTPSSDTPPLALNVSDELTVQWHVTELSPNPEAGAYNATNSEYVTDESVNVHVSHSVALRDIDPDELESPAHERL